MFAFVAAGTFPTIDEAQSALSPGYEVIEPDSAGVAASETLYQLFRPLYFALGQTDSTPVAAGRVLPELRRLAR
jgi:L-ribulokinase